MKHAAQISARQLKIDLTVPRLPPGMLKARFAEHVFDRVQRVSTSQVIAVFGNTICHSDNLGETWGIARTPFTEIELLNCFTTSAGTHLLQSRGWTDHADDGANSHALGRLYRFTPGWGYCGTSKAGEFHWHGTASIDQSGDTIMFADYPRGAPAKTDKPANVWRSQDDGQSWASVLSVPASQARHLHTCVADPFVPRSWYVSSGDAPRECHIWHSPDDGDTWNDVTDTAPTIELGKHASRLLSCHRYTDLIFDKEFIWWGTDDWLNGLGNPQGVGAEAPTGRSRLIRSRRSTPLKLESMGVLGLPVRSAIEIDDGFILLTEAKYPCSSYRPEVYFVERSSPFVITKLFDIDNFINRPTSFTLSRASKKALNGVFFTAKARSDAIDTAPYMLKWTVS